MSFTRNMLYGSMTTLVVKMVGVFVTFLLHIELTKKLVVSEYGIYVFVLSISIIISLLARLCIDTSIIRLMTEASNEKLIRGHMVFSICVAGVLSIVMSLLYTKIFYLPGGIHASSFIAMVLGMSVISICQGVMRFYSYNVMAFGPDLILKNGILLMILVFYFGDHVIGLAKIFQLHAISVLLVAFVSLAVMMSVHKTNMETAGIRYDFKEWSGIVMPLFLGTFLVVSEPQLLVVVAGWVVNDTEVAFVSLASRVAALAGLVTIATVMYITPIINRVIISDDLEMIRDKLAVCSRMMFLPSVPIFTFLVVFGENILNIFGAEYKDAYVPLLLISAFSLMSAFFGPVLLVCSICDSKFYAKTAFIFTMAFLIWSGFLGLMYGVLGVVCGYSVCMFARRVVCWARLRNTINVSCCAF